MAHSELKIEACKPLYHGPHRAATQAIALSKNRQMQIFRCVPHDSCTLPFYSQPISAGFPSPAEDYLEEGLDLHQLLVKHPVSTFFLRVSGNSMQNAGIYDGDILVVDRSLAPSHGKVVIASLNGELTVKRLCIQNKKVRLVAENEAYPPIDITEEMDLRIWGIVTSAIHRL